MFGGKRPSTSEEVLTSLRRQAIQAHENGKVGGRRSFSYAVNTKTSSRSDRINSDRINSDPGKNLIVEEKSILDRPDEKVLHLIQNHLFSHVDSSLLAICLEVFGGAECS